MASEDERPSSTLLGLARNWLWLQIGAEKAPVGSELLLRLLSGDKNRSLPRAAVGLALDLIAAKLPHPPSNPFLFSGVNMASLVAGQGLWLGLAGQRAPALVLLLRSTSVSQFAAALLSYIEPDGATGSAHEAAPRLGQALLDAAYARPVEIEPCQGFADWLAADREALLPLLRA